jgi:hypothetical protein
LNWKNFIVGLTSRCDVLFIKTLITALVVVGASELAKRHTLASALLISLPLTSILALIWIYYESKDTQQVITMSYSVFWLVIPSLAFFLLLPGLLRLHMQFIPALLISCLFTALLYSAGFWLYRQYMQ